MENAISDSATSRATFSDVETWKRSLDDSDRFRWQNPNAVVDSLRIRTRQRIADIGAGTGYFNSLFADAVGLGGRVYAVEIVPELVEYMRERAVLDQTPQVVCVLGTPSDPCLPDSLDLVFLCNTYRYLDGRRAYFARVREHLALDGRVAIIDYRESKRDTSGWRLPARRVIEEMGTAGFELVDEFGFLRKQYFLVFGKDLTRFAQ